MAIQATNYDGSKNYNVAEMRDLVKPNLLINADFKSGVINQKGSSKYNGNTGSTAYKLGYDKWLIGQFGSMEDKQSYMRFASAQSGTYIINKLSDVKPTGKTYTFTCKLLGKEPISKIIENVQTGNKLSVINDTDKDIYLEFNNNVFLVCVNLKSASKFVDIEFFKIEEGSAYTGMPIWNENIELAKCQRFLQIINQFKSEHSATAYGVSSYDCYMTIPMPIEMHKAPSVSGLIGANIKTTTIKGQKQTTVKSIIAAGKTQNGITIAFSANDVTNLGTYSPIIVEFVNSADIILDANEY